MLLKISAAGKKEESISKINNLRQICTLNLRFVQEFDKYLITYRKGRVTCSYKGLISLSQELNNPIYYGMVDPGLKSDVIQTLKIVTEKAYSAIVQ
jgi:hypothetical protein